MSDPLVFDVTVGRDDFMAGASLLARAKVRAWMPVFFIALPAVYLATQLLIYGPAAFRDPHNIGIFAIGTAIVALIPALSAPVLVPFTVRQAARRQFDHIAGLDEPARYVMDEQGFTARTAAEEEANAWSDITRALADKRVLLLCKTPTLAYTLPLDQIEPDTRRAIFQLVDQAGLFRTSWWALGRSS